MTRGGAASYPWTPGGEQASGRGGALRGLLWGAGGLNSVPASGGRARRAAEGPGRPAWYMLRGWVWTVESDPPG